MDNYIVSARKYRPDTFESVVGQHALTTTLKNAIASGKLAHSYLFCGPRGVGKTTCARIFAKTINCLHPKENGEACNECESCKAFNEQRSFNIHELDAASNNSVDDIRDLIEQVRIPPQVGKYKVFIIDEVHMLSAAAFNAFLKTLEEPPAHAIFILATTEKHKILPTILSRCQIYDFNRMEVNDIVNHLKGVAEKEGIKYEPDALNVIAQKADGGMRDALSIFDQVSSFTNGNITYQKVVEDLNVLDYEYYFRLTDLFLQKDIPNILLTFNEILSKGFPANQFIGGLASHFRDLLVCRDEATLGLLEVADDVKARYREQAQKCKPQFLFHALRRCNNCDLNYRASKNKRLLVEITLIEVAQDDDESAGRRPKKLKPIFKQEPVAQVAAAQQPQTKAPAGASVPAAGGTYPASAAATAATAEPKPTYTAPQPNLTAPCARTISIRIHGGQPAAAIGTAGSTSAASEKKDYGNEPVLQENLSLPWLQFANQLPKEQTAMKGRMKIIQPLLEGSDTVVVRVENSLVLQDFQEMQPKIEDFMRCQLHNSSLHLVVKLAENNAPQRAYSKKEQMELLLEKYPTLSLLRDKLGLDLA